MNKKIVVTVGPKSESKEILQAMIENGANIIRINMSHGSYEQCARIKKTLNAIKKETGLETKILYDLQGPRIRVCKIAHEMNLVEGEVYNLVYGEGNIDNMELPIDNKEVLKRLSVGDPVFLANGDLELKVSAIKKDKVYVSVERGGLLLPRKGVNIPKTILKSNILTKKDLLDVAFALTFKPDFIAMSFVQNGADVDKLRKLIAGTDIQIIVKVERGTALENIDDIIKKSDGIMVARGDLGIETPIEELPIVQKNLIRHAHWHNKPVIVATQMMTSMIDHIRPTRAEVSDVANAIFDGTDAVMLSDETAAGIYPVETVQMMKKVIEITDQYFNKRNYFEDDNIIYKK